MLFRSAVLRSPAAKRRSECNDAPVHLTFIVVVESLQSAVIVPASLAHGVGLAPFGVSFLDETEGVFHRDPILFGLVVVNHRDGHNLVAKRTMNSGGRHGSTLVRV